MADGYGYFGREIKTSGKLHQMLNEPNISPEKLFSVPNISGDINQNIQTFLNFCNKRRQFTTKMLKVCFNSSYQELQSDEIKKIAQYTIEVLTNDEVALSDFLFCKQDDMKSISQIQQKLDEDSTPASHTIQSEAERLFSDFGETSPQNKKQQKASWQNEPNSFEKYELIKLTLDHLKNNGNKPKNQTCLGYINKLYSSLLRREGNLFLHFLQQNKEYLDAFITNLDFFAVGGIVALMLSCEDKSGEYKYEQLKKQIFARILQYGLQNIENASKFEGFITTCEQILSSTKQSYYEYFQDFKRCANILVSEETLKKFYQKLSISEESFSNSSTYLQLILKRINNENEEHDYYKNHNADNDSNESTMAFEHQFLYERTAELVQFLAKSHSEKYASMKRIGFLGFFIGLLKNMEKKGKQPEISFGELFKKLIVVYSQETMGGLVKNYIFQVIKLAVKRIKQNQAKELAQWLITSNIQLSTLESLFQAEPSPQNSTIEGSNKNTTSCFILSILFEIQGKENTFLESYQKKNKINLTLAYERYKTKIANTSQDEDMISPTYQQIQNSFNLASKFKIGSFVKNEDDDQDKDKEKPAEKEPEMQVVGKNSVVIPVLHLPNKVENTKIIVQEEPVQQVKISAQLSRQALIRDLKNTKFELPDRFLKPKKTQEQKKAESPNQGKQVESQIVQSNEQVKKSLLKNIEERKGRYDNFQSPQKSEGGRQNTISAHSNNWILEQKYFVRHILLF